MAKRLGFVSDLHLFSDRSVASDYHSLIENVVANCDVFVLGGDIFDFKWSRLENLATSLASAKHWLSELIQSNRNCKFHFLMGNHDCSVLFEKTLEWLRLEHDNFDFNNDHLILADSLFLHGDVVDCGATVHELKKFRHVWANEEPKPKSEMHNCIYNWVVASQVHRPVAKWMNSQARVSRKIFRYMSDVGMDRAAIDRVFYGHTHHQNRFTVDGTEFRNGGAAIKGLAFEVVETKIG